MIEKGTDQAAVVEAITGWREEWSTQRTKKEQVWMDCLNAYLTQLDETKYDTYPWRSKAADPFVQETVDTLVSEIRNALFPRTTPYYRLVGNDAKSKKLAPYMKEYFDKQLKNSQLVHSIRPFLTQLVAIGNAPALLPWVHKERFVKLWQQGPNGVPKIGMVPKVTYDGFRFETLDAFDVYFDAGTTNLNDSAVIRVVETTEAALKQNKQLYKNLKNLETYKAGADYLSSKRRRAAAFGLTLNNEAGIQLEEIFGDFEIDGRIYYDYIGIVANHKTLLRFEPNPYWGGRPLIWGKFSDVWFSGYGRGTVEPVLGVYHLINTFTNQKADILNLIINGVFTYVDNGIVDPNSIVFKPGAKIPVRNQGDIQALHPSTNVALAFQEIEYLRQRGEGSTAVSRFGRGQGLGGRASAAEANMVGQGATTRPLDIIHYLGDTVAEPALNFFLTSTQQFKVGSREIQDEVLMGNYSIEYFGHEYAVKQQKEAQEFSQVMNFLGLISQLPPQFNSNELFDKLNEIFGTDVRKYITLGRNQQLSTQPPQQPGGPGIVGQGTRA